METILTPRLILRQIKPEEVNEFKALLRIEDIKSEFKNIAALDPASLIRELVVRVKDPKMAGFPWLWIINRETDQIEGFALGRQYLEPMKGYQIYYALHPSARGQRYATEALIGLTYHFITAGQAGCVFVRGEITNEPSKKTAIGAQFRVIQHRWYPDKFIGFVAEMMEPPEFMNIFKQYMAQASTQLIQL